MPSGQTTPEWKRVRIVRLLAQGFSHRETARLSDVSRATVEKIAKEQEDPPPKAA